MAERSDCPDDVTPCASSSGPAGHNASGKLQDALCPTCPICQGDVGFPVFLHTWMFPDTCKCRQPPMCLTCVRDMLQLNNRRDPQHTIYASCIICRKELFISQDSLSRGYTSRQIYNKDYDLAEDLDKKFGEITCPRCENWKGTRIDWDSKHLPDCPGAINRCSFAFCNYIGKEILEHRKTCKFAPRKCEFCGIFVESTIRGGRMCIAELNMEEHRKNCLPFCVGKFTEIVEDFLSQRVRIILAGESIIELANTLFQDEIRDEMIDVPAYLRKLGNIDPYDNVDKTDIASVKLATEHISSECRYCHTILVKFREIFLNM